MKDMFRVAVLLVSLAVATTALARQDVRRPYTWVDGTVIVAAHETSVTFRYRAPASDHASPPCSFNYNRPIPLLEDGSFRLVGDVVMANGLPRSDDTFRVAIRGRFVSRKELRLTYSLRDLTRPCVVKQRTVTANLDRFISSGGAPNRTT